jgi:hypothetical protein
MRVGRTSAKSATFLLATRGRIPQHVQYLERNGKRVPYVASPVPLREPESVAEILLWPTTPTAAETIVKGVLAELGYSDAIPVRRSVVAYPAGHASPTNF